jgi:hypothetical protein
MMKLRKVLVLAALIAAPAGAMSYFAGAPEACFTSGTTTYRVSAASEADYTVRFAETDGEADLRIQLMDSPDQADFVLVDDGGIGTSPCKGPAPVKTIRIDADAKRPHVTVRLATDLVASDYRIYVHSARFSHQDAAALLAVISKMQARYKLVGQR